MTRFRIGVAAAALLALSTLAMSLLKRPSNAGFLPIVPPTPFIHYKSSEPSLGSAIVVHGLDSSKEFMTLFATTLAASGYDVTSIDLPGHGDSRVPFNAMLARTAVANAVHYLQTKSANGALIGIGHSIGAGFLLDVAHDTSFPTLVLLSPPPMPVLSLKSDRTLIATGDLDIPAINEFIPQLIDLEPASVVWWKLKWAAHSSSVLNPKYVGAIVQWITHESSSSKRPLWMLLCVALQGIAALALVTTVFPGSRIAVHSNRISPVLVHYVAACCAAVLILWLVSPMKWLHLFATDYLISFVLVVGLVLLPIRSHASSIPPIQASIRSILSAFGMIAVLALIGSNFMHMIPTGNRLWRFPCIAAASFPLFWADEVRLRGNGSMWKSLAAVTLTRGILVSGLVVGVLSFDRKNAFVVLISYLMIAFWLGIWALCGIVRRHTQNAFATALFGALLQGWLFAAWFVIV